MPFRCAQLAFHLCCKEPTMTHRLQFQFRLCCLLFKMIQCLFCVLEPVVRGWPVPCEFCTSQLSPIGPMPHGQCCTFLDIPTDNWSEDAILLKTATAKPQTGQQLAWFAKCLLNVLVWVPQHTPDKNLEVITESSQEVQMRAAGEAETLGGRNAGEE